MQTASTRRRARGSGSSSGRPSSKTGAAGQRGAIGTGTLQSDLYSAELRDKLRRHQRLTPERDLACIIDVSVSAELERLEAKRFGKTNKPRKHVDDADTAPGVRGISAAVKRFVWARDGGQCSFVSDDGKRCPERHALEFDHDEPYGVGGDRSPDNIRLACRTHNLYLAELDYGKEKMDRYRRSPDRVGEPAPAFNF